MVNCGFGIGEPPVSFCRVEMGVCEGNARRMKCVEEDELCGKFWGGSCLPSWFLNEGFYKGFF